MLAAISLGGTGIWVMHFMAMIGFGVDGSEIRYDIPITALSVVVAVAVVGVGLFIVGLGRPNVLKILSGGLFAGLGVNAMHYLGMAAMRLDGEIFYDTTRVLASIAIAVVAATVALWLSVTVKSGAAIFGSAMVMGVAVTGMHYTGMSAMSVELSEQGDVTGASSTTLIAPISLAVVLVVMGLLYSVLAAPTDEDRAGAAYLASRMSGETGPVGVWAGSSAAPEVAAADGGAPGSGSAASRFARRGSASPAGGGAPAGSGFVPSGGNAAGGLGAAGRASGASGGVGSAQPPAGGGFAPGGAVPPARPQPGDPAPAGLGASLRETEPFPEGQASGGGRWAGLTERTHPTPRPISERQYSGADYPPDAPPMDPPVPLPRRSGEQGQLPQRNSRDPWTPSPTPTRHE